MNLRLDPTFAYRYLTYLYGIHRYDDTLAAKDRSGELASRLLAAVDELRRPQLSGERLMLRSGGRITFMPFEQIDWLAAEGNYVRVHAGCESHLIRETMLTLHAQLGERFFRIHRSDIVNVSRIKELRLGAGGDYDVVLKDGTTLALSRLYKDALQARLAGTP